MMGQGNVYETSIFEGEPAFFGKQWFDTISYGNLYLPPMHVDPTLCDISSLSTDSNFNTTDMNITETDVIPSKMPQPISRHKSRRLIGNDDFVVDSDSLALLVRRGGCEFVTKALNAMAINDLYANSAARIDIVIVYNYIDADIFETDANSPFYMYYDDERAEEASTVDLRLVAIGYSSGIYMNETMMLWHKSEISPKPNSPFLDETAFLPVDDVMRSKWFFPVRFEFNYRDNRSGARSLLFIMIIITALFPLSRVLLVCVGGYVCRLRRNDSGRIIGMAWSRRNVPNRRWSESLQMFQFIFQQNSNDGPLPLTLEEVNTLPTIAYGVDNLADTLERYKQSHFTGDDSANDEDGDIRSTETLSKKRSDAESKTQPDNVVCAAFESSTSCSICICDFEHNERVMLLPLCGHIFHTDCITPWLTEKKRSCPLCSRNVLEIGTDSQSLREIARIRHFEETGVLTRFPFGIAENSSQELDHLAIPQSERLNVQELVPMQHQRSSDESNIQEPSAINHRPSGEELNHEESVTIQNVHSDGESGVQESTPPQHERFNGELDVEQSVPTQH